MAKSKGLSFYKRKKKISPVLIREIFAWLFGIMTAVLLAGVLTYFYGMSTNVVGVSMEPTLYNSQQIFIDRFIYTLSTPKVGDVVVFLPNGNENAHYYVKRIVAVSGDRVQIREGFLYVNDQLSEVMPGKIVDPGIAENVLTLAGGECFCIGDNPNNSEDSRSANIGPVKDEDILGKAWLRLSQEESKFGFIR
jgi:signal peptidase I